MQIIGEGSSGVILGKGLRMSNGVNNIIIQNIEVSSSTQGFAVHALI